MNEDSKSANPRFHALNHAIAQLVCGSFATRFWCLRNLQIEDHPLVSFIPLDLTSSDSLEYVLSSLDFTMQYGEDEEPKEVSSLNLTIKAWLMAEQPKDLDEGDFADME